MIRNKQQAEDDRVAFFARGDNEDRDGRSRLKPSGLRQGWIRTLSPERLAESCERKAVPISVARSLAEARAWAEQQPWASRITIGPFQEADRWVWPLVRSTGRKATTTVELWDEAIEEALAHG